MDISQIDRGAWILIGELYRSNSIVLERGDAALLIDGTGSDGDARELRRFVTGKLGKTVRFIVSTHYFADHLAGFRWFSEAEIIAQERYRETWDMEQFRSAEEEAFYVQPSITFGDRMDIRWGDFALRMQSNPGHTPSTIFIDIPQLDLVCAGDSFVGNIAYIRYGDPEAALERLIALGRGRYVGSHGGLRTDQPAARALAYLRALRRGERDFALTPFERIFHTRNLEDLAGRSGSS